MTRPPDLNSTLSEQIADIVLKVIMAGGLAGGGLGAFWSLFKDSDVPKAIASAGIGLGLSYAAKMISPIHKGNQRRLQRAGQALDGGLDQITEAAIATATRFEHKYLLCQASDCESLRSEGMVQREGIFVPLLEEVFVQLQIDSSGVSPGFADNQSIQNLNTTEAQTIWDFLAESKKQKVYRQLAILAWGGYGKTTLLKHIAYRYGKGLAPRNAPKLIPILLVLRKYIQQLSKTAPLSLPELINEVYIPSLPQAHLLTPLPKNWALNLLQRGRALVMFDGFDEVPKQERAVVAKWVNKQIRLYDQSVFIVTSRPKAYREQDPASQLTLSVSLWVKDFNDSQRRSFVENWYLCQERYAAMRDTPEVRNVASKAAEELLAQIEAQIDLKDLAKNPLLLNMITTFHRRYPGADLPRRRVDLFQEICSLQLRDRPKARKLDTVLFQFESQPVLEKLAFVMMEQSLKRIEREAILEQIKKVLREEENIESEKFLNDVVQISELLVQQEDEYEFAHLSFQEYLAATYISAEPNREELLYKYLKDDWWKATILLYAGKARKPTGLIREALRQGEKNLAYACLLETTKRVDSEIRGELQAIAKQVQDTRYTDLEHYLKNGQWKDADGQTYSLMITTVWKEEGQFFEIDDLLYFPCGTLKLIDDLWMKYSDGKFGFSAQLAIYRECGGISDENCDMAWTKFCLVNGWQGDNNSTSIKFDITSPHGHLPTLIYRIKEEGKFSALMSKFADCTTYFEP